jgi:hypothetical protein
MIDSVSELSAFSTNSGFIDGESVTVTQTGAIPAEVTFTNIGTDEVDESELTIVSSATGFVSGSVLITQGLFEATATYTDLNGDKNVEANELKVTNSDTGFADGTVTIEQGTFVATADFVDDVDRINAGDLSAVTIPGSSFTTGTVTLTGVTSTATATATFTDIPTVNQFGPMDEIAPDAGIFELDLTVKYTDGPSDSKCPAIVDFDAGAAGI